MEKGHAILWTLIVYNGVLIAIGLWASGRTHNEGEFFLGGRRLGAWVAALSASASSSSAWTLLGVSGAAYLWGLPALWLIPATVSGFVINWCFVAPRIRSMSIESNAITLTEFLAPPEPHRLRPVVRNIASLIILFSFVFYVAAQLQATGKTFHAVFDLSPRTSVMIGALIVVFYTMVGGFWAVSVTDLVQGLLMVGTAIVLPIVGLIAVGGPAGLWRGLHELGQPQLLSVTTQTSVLAGFAFVIGLMGIGLGYPGQPHVVNRFMAIRDEKALKRGRAISITWALLIYIGMVVLGLCGRVLVGGLADREQVLFYAAEHLLPPVIAGIATASVLSAIMSTVDSQLLVAASCVTYDSSLNFRSMSPARKLMVSRITVVIVSGLAVWIALGVREAIFSRVLFAWSAMGSAFGPLLLVRLSGRSIGAASTLTSMLVGFVGTVILNQFPDLPGDVAERFFPFVLALLIAWIGSRSSAGATRNQSGAR